MRYLLTLHMNPAKWENLTDEQRNEVFQGHGTFTKTISESGEMVETKAVEWPSNCTTVRVRDGEVSVTDGLYGPAGEFLCGYYVVDCATRERAIELAALIPDAKYTGVEVRPVVHEAGPAS